MIFQRATTLVLLAVQCLAQFDMAPFGERSLVPCNRPKPTYNNTWTIENFETTIQNKSLTGITFNLYRTVFSPCSFGLNDFFKDVIPCGWVNMNFPIQCDAGVTNMEKVYEMRPGETMPDVRDPPALREKEKWFSCNLYPRGVEGERKIGEESKRWIKWRLAKVDVGGGDDNAVQETSQNISFRSVKVEFKSAILQPRLANSTSAATPMVKVFTAFFGMENGVNGRCNHGVSNVPGYYSCAPVQDEAVGITCGFMGVLMCQFSVNVTDEIMPASRFLELTS